MATIAELMVRIDANSRGLDSALKKSESRVKRFANKVKKTIGVAFKVGIAAAVTSIAALTAGLIRAGAAVDQLAKTSTKLGIATEELQKMQLQAKLSGVSVETLNMSLQRMIRRVSEAARGTGEAVKALEELGLNAKELNRLSPDRQFQRIAEAMSKVANQSDKVRLAMKLFDSEGVALVNTLGSDLAGVAKKFEELGLGISKTQAKTIEAMNDSRVLLGAIFDDIAAKVLSELAPSFQLLTDGVIAWVKEMGGAGAVAKRVAEVIKDSFLAAKAVIDFFTPAFQGIKMAVQLLAPVVQMVFQGWAILIENLQGLVSKLIESLVRVADKLKSIRQAATTSVLDLLPNLQFDPNAPGNPNAPGAVAARASRARNQQNITVQIIADKEGLVTAVVTDEKFRQNINAVADKVMKDTARATRR